MGRKEPQQAPLIQKNGPVGFFGAHSFYQLLTLGQVLVHTWGPPNCAVDARRVVQPGLAAFVYYYFSMARTLAI